MMTMTMIMMIQMISIWMMMMMMTILWLKQLKQLILIILKVQKGNKVVIRTINVDKDGEDDDENDDDNDDEDDYDNNDPDNIPLKIGYYNKYVKEQKEIIKEQKIDINTIDKYIDIILLTSVCSHFPYIATGGKDRDVIVYHFIVPPLLNNNNNNNDHNNDKKINHDDEIDNNIMLLPYWKAKHLPPNPQTLLQSLQSLLWPTAMIFINNDNNNEYKSILLAVGTAYKQICIYRIPLSTSIV